MERKDNDANDAIAKVNNEADLDQREEVYTKYREPLQHQIRLMERCSKHACLFVYSRNSSKNIKKMCRGFFSHSEHLARHFTWLTNVDSLVGSVEENLHKQIGNSYWILCLLQSFDLLALQRLSCFLMHIFFRFPVEVPSPR